MIESIERLTELLLSGNQDEAWNIVWKKRQQGFDTFYIFQQFISVSMAQIGMMWEEDEISVADEHLATTTCDYILSRYQLCIRQEVIKNEKKGLFLCIENEQHFLGLKMISILFEEHGWQTKLLGADSPLLHATHAVEQWKPDLVGISFSLTHHIEKASEYIEGLQKTKHQPLILVGGRVVSNYKFPLVQTNQVRFIAQLEELKEFFHYQSIRGIKVVDY
ncbi:cobalamin B12-binding domain-containing protein [Priestia megaterium]|uniref:cobalamin B12-binding domain-containing protein n=1 Tax=Priestia megaterium TaxID=1404 RepID=UPI0024537265|nr:cobalamin B12-binding domain-containing protein [Priestia megaterium]MDH3158965.1 cobalamin B12-binding domain-containing protein [Priestia megaterium]MED4115628.1 cobalamin B12-binding domain-containing protein [Priestia megaterium]